MADRELSPDPRFSADTILGPFIFVPHGDPEPTDWLVRHPGAIRIKATFVPRGGRSAGSDSLDPNWSEAFGRFWEDIRADETQTDAVAPFVGSAEELREWTLPSDGPAAPPPAAHRRQPAKGNLKPDDHRHKNEHKKIDLPDEEARLALARSLVHPGRNATAADVEVTVKHLANVLNLGELRRIAKDGLGYRVTEGSVGIQFPEMYQAPAPGYPPGMSSGDAPGVYHNETREVVVATKQAPGGTRRLPDGRDSISADVALHELGHGINETEIGPASGSLTRSYMSDSDVFTKAYQADSNQGALGNEYFHQRGASGAPHDRSRSEAFAESFAIFIRHPKIMRALYPHLYAYFEARERQQ